MIYTIDGFCAANTDRENAVAYDLRVYRGIIHKVSIAIPAGHQYLTGMVILHGGHQIVPVNDASFIQGEDEELVFEEYYPLMKETNYLRVLVWNNDDTHCHHFYIRISVLDEAYLNPFKPFTSLI